MRRIHCIPDTKVDKVVASIRTIVSQKPYLTKIFRKAKGEKLTHYSVCYTLPPGFSLQSNLYRPAFSCSFHSSRIISCLQECLLATSWSCLFGAWGRAARIQKAKMCFDQHAPTMRSRTSKLMCQPKVISRKWPRSLSGHQENQLAKFTTYPVPGKKCS